MRALRVLCRLAAYELVEVAALSTGRRFLIQQCQAALVKFVEPVIPRDLFQRALAAVTRKVDAQNADISIASGVPHARRTSSALLRPLADLIMIDSRSTCC